MNRREKPAYPSEMRSSTNHRDEDGVDRENILDDAAEVLAKLEQIRRYQQKVDKKLEGLGSQKELHNEEKRQMVSKMQTLIKELQEQEYSYMTVLRHMLSSDDSVVEYVMRNNMDGKEEATSSTSQPSTSAVFPRPANKPRRQQADIPSNHCLFNTSKECLNNVETLSDTNPVGESYMDSLQMPFDSTELESLKRQSETLLRVLEQQGTKYAKAGLRTAQRLQNRDHSTAECHNSSSVRGTLQGQAINQRSCPNQRCENGQSNLQASSSMVDKHPRPYPFDANLNFTGHFTSSPINEDQPSHRNQMEGSLQRQNDNGMTSGDDITDNTSQLSNDSHQSKEELSFRISILQEQKDQVDDLLEQLSMLRNDSDSVPKKNGSSSRCGFSSRSMKSISADALPSQVSRHQLQNGCAGGSKSSEMVESEQTIQNSGAFHKRLNDLQQLMEFYDSMTQSLPLEGEEDSKSQDESEEQNDNEPRNGGKERCLLSELLNGVQNIQVPTEMTLFDLLDGTQGGQRDSTSLRGNTVDRHNVRQLGRLIQFLQSGQSTSQLPDELLSMFQDIATGQETSISRSQTLNQPNHSTCKLSEAPQPVRHVASRCKGTRGTPTRMQINRPNVKPPQGIGNRNIKRSAVSGIFDDLALEDEGDSGDGDVVFEDAEEEEEETQSVKATTHGLPRHQHAPYARVFTPKSTQSHNGDQLKKNSSAMNYSKDAATCTFPKGLEAKARGESEKHSTSNPPSIHQCGDAPNMQFTQDANSSRPLHTPYANGDNVPWQVVCEQVNCLMMNIVSMQQQMMGMWNQMSRPHQLQSTPMLPWMQQMNILPWEQQHNSTPPLLNQSTAQPTQMTCNDLNQRERNIPSRNTPMEATRDQGTAPHRRPIPAPNNGNEKFSSPVAQIPCSNVSGQRSVPTGLTLWSSDDSVLRAINSSRSTYRKEDGTPRTMSREPTPQPSSHSHKEKIIVLVEHFLSQNQSHPQYLLDILQLLQDIDSDSLRQNAVQQLKSVIEKDKENRNKRETGSLYAATLRKLAERTAKLFNQIQPEDDKQGCTFRAADQSSERHNSPLNSSQHCSIRFRQGPVGGPAGSSNSTRNVSHDDPIGDVTKNRLINPSVALFEKRSLTTDTKNQRLSQNKRMLHSQPQKSSSSRHDDDDEDYTNEEAFSSTTLERVSENVRRVLHLLLPFLQKGSNRTIITRKWQRRLLALIEKYFQEILFHDERCQRMYGDVQQQLRSQIISFLRDFEGNRLGHCRDSLIRGLAGVLHRNFLAHYSQCSLSQRQNDYNYEIKEAHVHDRPRSSSYKPRLSANRVSREHSESSEDSSDVWTDDADLHGTSNRIQVREGQNPNKLTARPGSFNSRCLNDEVELAELTMRSTILDLLNQDNILHLPGESQTADQIFNGFQPNNEECESPAWDEEERLVKEHVPSGSGTVVSLAPCETKPLNLIGSDEDEVDAVSGCSADNNRCDYQVEDSTAMAYEKNGRQQNDKNICSTSTVDPPSDPQHESLVNTNELSEALTDLKTSDICNDEGEHIESLQTQENDQSSQNMPIESQQSRDFIPTSGQKD